MKIGIPKETAPGEKRVAIVPETVKKLAAKKIESVVESLAGMASSFSDAEYQAAGALVVASPDEVVMKSEEERIAALEKALAEAHLKLLVHEKIIEVASKKYKVDLKKTFGPQALSRPEERPPPGSNGSARR